MEKKINYTKIYRDRMNADDSTDMSYETLNVDMMKEAVKQAVEMTDHQLSSGLKEIVGHHFSSQRDKPRIADKEKNRELMNFIGDFLTTLEMDVKRDISAFLAGVDIKEIVPKTETT